MKTNKKPLPINKTGKFCFRCFFGDGSLLSSPIYYHIHMGPSKLRRGLLGLTTYQKKTCFQRVVAIKSTFLSYKTHQNPTAAKDQSSFDGWFSCTSSRDAKCAIESYHYFFKMSFGKQRQAGINNGVIFISFWHCFVFAAVMALLSSHHVWPFNISYLVQGVIMLFSTVGKCHYLPVKAAKQLLMILGNP